VDISAQLPVRDPWFTSEDAGPGVRRIVEPGVHPFLRANIWHVRGRDRDLWVDAGMGIASLAEAFPAEFARDRVLFVTHGHLDHAGGAREFPDRRCHVAEASVLEQPEDETLITSELSPEFSAALAADEPGGVPPEFLVDSVPDPQYDVAGYRVRPAAPTTTLADGDVIDLGDRAFTVVHLPGHTPGSSILFDETNGVLFTGDVLYDGELLDELPESSIESYVASMQRLLELDASVAFPGHEQVLGPDDVQRIGRRYLERRSG
jgi:glyoxylase-like metal-dependent hydrolase (beta-lactamase superfamily II)